MRWPGRAAPRAAWRGDGGSAAAELAVALPAVVAVLGLCLGALGAAATQAALADAAADAARILARGDDPALAEARLAQAAEEASMEVSGEAILCVDARAPIRIAGLGIGVEATARACALGGGR